MKRSNIDVTMLGRYVIVDNRMEVMIESLDRNGWMRKVSFQVPIDDKYLALSSKVILTPQIMSEGEIIPCTFFVRSAARIAAKDEKAELVKQESAGNPLTARALQRIDFNIVAPVDVKIRIDDQIVTFVPNQSQTVTLSKGAHSVIV